MHPGSAEFTYLLVQKIVKPAVIKKTGELISETAQNKSTMTYLCKGFRYKLHSTVSQVKNPRQVIRACVKTSHDRDISTASEEGEDEETRLKRADSAICPLCSSKDEDD